MQRYFLTAESTYEMLRQSLNIQLRYPNALGQSVFQTPLQAPRDKFGRVLLAVDTAVFGYDSINSAIATLIASELMEEVNEAAYLAAVASSTSVSGLSQIGDVELSGVQSGDVLRYSSSAWRNYPEQQLLDAGNF